jgi:hypothetical protein
MALQLQAMFWNVKTSSIIFDSIERDTQNDNVLRESFLLNAYNFKKIKTAVWKNTL